MHACINNVVDVIASRNCQIIVFLQISIVSTHLVLSTLRHCTSASLESFSRVAEISKHRENIKPADVKTCEERIIALVSQ